MVLDIMYHLNETGRASQFLQFRVSTERITMSRLWRIAGVLLVVCFFTPSSGDAQRSSRLKTERYKGAEVVSNEVLVKFNTNSAIAINQAQANADIDQAPSIGGIGAFRFHSRS